MFLHIIYFFDIIFKDAKIKNFFIAKVCLFEKLCLYLQNEILNNTKNE